MGFINYFNKIPHFNRESYINIVYEKVSLTNNNGENMKRAEEWKWVEGFEGKYKISSHGRLMSFKCQTGAHRTGSGIRKEGKILKPQYSKNGYVIYRMYNEDDTYTQQLAHRLVYRAFIGEIPDYDHKGNHIDVDHISGVRDENYVWNLRIISHEENCRRSNIGKAQSKKVFGKDRDGNIVYVFNRMKDGKEHGYSRELIYLSIKEDRYVKGIKFEYVSGGVR